MFLSHHVASARLIVRSSALGTSSKLDSNGTLETVTIRTHQCGTVHAP